MQVFSQEKDDGLEQIIRNNQSIAYTTLAIPSYKTKTVPNLERHLLKANANPNQVDLYYLDSILVSVGWNKNDDVFDSHETWNSRFTPVDKQFNFMHDESDIIGHITSSCVVVDDKIYESDEVPDDFNVVVGSVLYKYWEDKTLQKRMQEIIGGIEEGEWYVSMECLFNDFDYQLISPLGKKRTVARDESSAFLTKHLRAYGGTGEYEEHRVGRLIRNFIFSGKGLVKKPANPKSIIFVPNQNSKGNSKMASAYGENEMSDAYKAQADELKRELENEKNRSKRMEQQIKENADKEYKERMDTLNAEIETLTAELETNRAQLKEQNEKVVSLEHTNESLVKKYDEASKDLSNAKAEVVKVVRLSMLAKAGISGKQADAICKKFASTPDDVFTEFVQLYANQNQASVTEATKGEHFEEEQDEEDEVEDFDFGKANVSPTVVNSGKSGDSKATVQKATADWIRSSFKLTRNKVTK